MPHRVSIAKNAIAFCFKKKVVKDSKHYKHNKKDKNIRIKINSKKIVQVYGQNNPRYPIESFQIKILKIIIVQN